MHTEKHRSKVTAVILLAALLLMGCSVKNPTQTTAPEKPEAPTADEPETHQPPEDTDRTIVVFFSCTGHTKPLAEYAAEALHADLYEIKAKIPYTDDDIRYYTDCRADREQSDPNARPEIAGELPDMTGYSVVFLGYPIWHGQAPRIIDTFLESVDLSGKRIIPFCTSGSSPIGLSAKNLHALAPDADWDEGRRFEIGTTGEKIESWVVSIVG